MGRCRRRENGFTLVELLAVLIIVAILAAIGTPIYMQYVKSARASEAQTAIGAIYTAEKVYLQKYGKVAQFDELEKARQLKVDESTKNNWKFTITPDGREGVKEIVATSTGNGPVPAGEFVRYSVQDGKFYGYGNDEE